MVGSTVPHEDDLHLATGYTGPAAKAHAWQQGDRKRMKRVETPRHAAGATGSLVELVLLFQEFLFEHRILDGLRLLVEQRIIQLAAGQYAGVQLAH